MSCSALRDIKDFFNAVPQFFSDYAAFMPCAQGEDSPFYYTEVEKVAQENDSVGSVYREVFLRTPYSKFARIDRASKEVYKGDPLIAVSIKCIAIMLALSVFTAGMIVWHSGRTLVMACVCATRAIGNLINLQENESFWNTFKQGWVDLGFTMGQGLWDVVKSPLCMIAMDFVALTGIINPDCAHKYTAKIELAWHNGRSYEEDFIRRSHTVRSWWEVLDRPIYLAMCFQVMGKLEEADDQLEPLSTTKGQPCVEECFFPQFKQNLIF